MAGGYGVLTTCANGDSLACCYGSTHEAQQAREGPVGFVVFQHAAGWIPRILHEKHVRYEPRGVPQRCGHDGITRRWAGVEGVDIDRTYLDLRGVSADLCAQR